MAEKRIRWLFLHKANTAGQNVRFKIQNWSLSFFSESAEREREKGARGGAQSFRENNEKAWPKQKWPNAGKHFYGLYVQYQEYTMYIRRI